MQLPVQVAAATHEPYVSSTFAWDYALPMCKFP